MTALEEELYEDLAYEDPEGMSELYEDEMEGFEYFDEDELYAPLTVKKRAFIFPIRRLFFLYAAIGHVCFIHRPTARRV